MHAAFTKTLRILAVGGAVALMTVATATVAPKKAEANPSFAAQTGKPCAFCHTAPPALNNAGKAFKAKGNKL